MGGDKIFNDNYYIDLITQTPLNYNGLIIYQPTFNEIKEIGIDTYNQIMQPYMLTLECFPDVPKDKNINLFNDILINDEYLLSCIGESLYILAKPKEIIFNKKSKSLQLKFFDTVNKKADIKDKEKSSIKNRLLIIFCKLLSKVFNKKIKSVDVIEKEETIERVFTIDSNNFDDICEIILKINSNKKVEIEKPPENMSERQRDVWEKLQEGRQRSKNKNEVHIYDILNVCEFGGDYHIPMKEIMNWTLWKITDCYKARVGIKNYNDNLQIALVSGDGKLISGENHWHHQLMIRE
jgi:hypothetical protein